MLVLMLWALMCESALEMCVSTVLVGWLEVWTGVEGVTPRRCL